MLSNLNKTRNRASLAILLVVTTLLALTIPMPAADAQVSFYTGDIVLNTLNASIDIQEKAQVSSDYILINKGNQVKQVDLTFYPADAVVSANGEGFSNPVTFQPYEEKYIHLTYEWEIGGNYSQDSDSNLRAFGFDPIILFDGMYNSERTESYNVRIILPENITKLVASNKAYDSTETEAGRAVYYWNMENTYPTSLNIKWSTLPVDIAVEIIAPGEITEFEQVIDVTLIIENKGESEVVNITLTDKFHPADFEAVSPLEDFHSYAGNVSDPMLIWNKSIDVLESGETREFKYSLRLKNVYTDTTLGPVTVMVGSSLVAVSNEVTVESKIPVGEETPTPTPTPTLAGGGLGTGAWIGIGIGILLVIGLGIWLILRRRK